MLPTKKARCPASRSAMNRIRNKRRNSLPSTRTGKRHAGRDNIQRVPSRAMPPPGTIMWIWGRGSSPCHLCDQHIGGDPGRLCAASSAQPTSQIAPLPCPFADKFHICGSTQVGARHGLSSVANMSCRRRYQATGKPAFSSDFTRPQSELAIPGVPDFPSTRYPAVPTPAHANDELRDGGPGGVQELRSHPGQPLVSSITSQPDQGHAPGFGLKRQFEQT